MQSSGIMQARIPRPVPSHRNPNDRLGHQGAFDLANGFFFVFVFFFFCMNRKSGNQLLICALYYRLDQQVFSVSERCC